jgi:hypothetical protein
MTHQRFNLGTRVGYATSSSWRLLLCEALGSRLSHHSCITSSEEPPLQISTVRGTSPPDALTTFAVPAARALTSDGRLYSDVS